MVIGTFGQSEPRDENVWDKNEAKGIPWVRPSVVLSGNQQQYKDDYRNQSEPGIKENHSRLLGSPYSPVS